MAERLLDVSGLKKYYPIKKNLLGKPGAYVKAVNGVDFFINKGETLGLVGESGCGKSTVGKCIIGLEAITEGSITMDGLEISAMKEQERRHIRKDIQMVFQNPYASLNQRRNILQIIDEPMQVNLDLSRTERVARTKELLRMVGLRDEYCSRYPHEFSGGQRQRIAIARALSVNPRLVIADEAVSALDVTIQAQVLELLLQLRNRMKMAMLFVSHNLSVVRCICDRVTVMYLGRIVESGTVEAVFSRPLHPYTKLLMASTPGADAHVVRYYPKGAMPSPIDRPKGCVFASRCPLAEARCRTDVPPLRDDGSGHLAACFSGPSFLLHPEA